MKHKTALSILLIALALPAAFLVAAPAGPTQKQGNDPNVLIDISAALVNAAAQRSIDRTERVNEVILETPVCGTSRALGNMRAELVPDPCHAAVDLVLNSHVYARTVGTRPHVYLYTSSVTCLEARRRIVIDEKGFRAFTGPACGQATTCLHDIKCCREPDPFAIWFAGLAFQQGKHEAEGETAHKSAMRASSRMAEELAPALTSASESVARGLAKLTRTGVAVEFLDFNSTAAFLEGRLGIRAPRRSSPSQGPTLPADTDLGLRIHQSFFNEVGRAALRGRSIPLNEVDKFYEDATLGLLPDARPSGEQKIGLQKLQKMLHDLAGKPTRIVLSQSDPVTVAFNERGFAIETHLASTRQGETTYRGVRVQANYLLENSSQGVLLVRQGPIRFLPDSEAPPGKKLEEPPVSLLILREVLFAEIFKERLILNDGPLLASIAQVRLSRPRVATRNGWLALTWKLGTRSEEKSAVPEKL